MINTTKKGEGRGGGGGMVEQEGGFRTEGDALIDDPTRTDFLSTPTNLGTKKKGMAGLRTRWYWVLRRILRVREFYVKWSSTVSTGETTWPQRWPKRQDSRLVSPKTEPTRCRVSGRFASIECRCSANRIVQTSLITH